MSAAGHTELVDDFLEFFRNYYREEIGELAAHFPNEQRALVIDRTDLDKYDPDLTDDFLSNPENIREHAEDALARFDVPVDVDLTGASVRLSNLNDAHVSDVGDYENNDVGKLVGVTGQVTRQTQKDMRFKETAFECQRCGNITYIPQAGEDMQEPHECKGCEREGPFTINWGQSDLVDYQLLRLQLPPERADGSEDETIDIDIEGDLVNETTPGDRITANLVLQGRQKKDESTTAEFYGDAMSIEHEETTFEDLEITDEDKEKIEAIAADTPFEDMVGSIAPTLHGLDTEKLAVALQTIGGVRKTLPDGSVIRGDSHVLFVGDPGVGKSELLVFAEQNAPRSVFSDGTGSTSAGLTASAVRDDFGDSGEWTIKGGTIVKAHKGLACVDELDDMDEEDRSSLHTALERQEVPVAKAGINTTLPAQTKLLAAANPKNGRFDQYEPIPGQINLKPTLVSRFDLIFTIQDNNDTETDRAIIQHKADTAEAGQRLEAGKEITDEQREKTEPVIDPELMQKYVAYARRIVPVFDDDAKELLVDEFQALRQLNADADADPDDRPVPVTYRKQEAVTRFAEASARARLSETIEREDVKRALRLVKRSMKDVGLDPETGQFDADIVETGSSRSQDQRFDYVKAMIREFHDEGSHGAPIDMVVEAAAGDRYTESKIEQTIDELKQDGRAYEPADEQVRVA